MTGAERLLGLVRECYADLMPTLGEHRGHCREVSTLAYHLARALGLTAARCAGVRVLLPGPVHDAHSWVRLDDQILHSPRRGEVSLEPYSPEQFIERWRTGPPPPAPRRFKVPSR